MEKATVTGKLSTDLTSPRGATIDPDTPAGRVLENLANGRQEVFYGACTPFKNIILEKLGHPNSWVSSFELSALLGERDDETIGFDETFFFAKRIRRKCPNANMFIDCDTGWSPDPDRIADYFQQLSTVAALVGIQNLKPGTKDNSFRRNDVTDIDTPRDLAVRMQAICDAAPNTLVVLRLENNVLKQPLEQTMEYIHDLFDRGPVFDYLLYHHASDDISSLLSFSDAFYRHYPEQFRLVAVTTAYVRTPNLLARLSDANYKAVVIPNFSIRLEYTTHRDMYSKLGRQEFEALEGECGKMADVMKLIYSR